MTRKQAVFIILVNAMISTLISLGIALLVILPNQGNRGGLQQVEAIPKQAESTAQETSIPETVTPTPPTATPIAYIVQPGDTISSLALKFDVPGADIIAANQIQNPDFLVAGVELSIPVGGLPPATATWVPMPAASETPLPFEPPSVNQTATAVSAAGETPPERTSVDGGPQLAITQIVGAGLTEQEQATIRNVGDQLADLEGWTLSDAEGNTYVFPNYRLWPQSSVTVHTGIGQDGEPLSSLFWGRLESVWRPGEMATLRNAEGLALATYVVNP